VVLVVCLFGGMFVYKRMQRSKAEADARAAVPQLLAMSAVYKDHRAYIDGLLNEGHRDAFAKAYRDGGLFAPSEYDEQVYVETIIAFIASRAKADGKPEFILGLPGTHKEPSGAREKRFPG
jgi:hypothetical protein